MAYDPSIIVATPHGRSWAAGQTVAAVGSGALAQATSDPVPYSLLAAACLATLGLARIRTA